MRTLRSNISDVQPVQPTNDRTPRPTSRVQVPRPTSTSTPPFPSTRAYNQESRTSKVEQHLVSRSETGKKEKPDKPTGFDSIRFDYLVWCGSIRFDVPSSKLSMIRPPVQLRIHPSINASTPPHPARVCVCGWRCVLELDTGGALNGSQLGSSWSVGQFGQLELNYARPVGFASHFAFSHLCADRSWLVVELGREQVASYRYSLLATRHSPYGQVQIVDFLRGGCVLSPILGRGTVIVDIADTDTPQKEHG